MIKPTIMICNMLTKQNYSFISLENTRFETILFYDNKTNEKIIYGTIYSKDDADNDINIGNISLNSDGLPVLGCNIALKKDVLSENKFSECIYYIGKAVNEEYEADLLDEQMRYVQKFTTVHEIINLYISINNYNINNQYRFQH